MYGIREMRRQYRRRNSTHTLACMEKNPQRPALSDRQSRSQSIHSQRRWVTDRSILFRVDMCQCRRPIRLEAHLGLPSNISPTTALGLTQEHHMALKHRWGTCGSRQLRVTDKTLVLRRGCRWSARSQPECSRAISSEVSRQARSVSRIPTTRLVFGSCSRT